MKNRILAITAVLAALLLTCSGCGSKSTAMDSGSSNGAPQQSPMSPMVNVDTPEEENGFAPELDKMEANDSATSGEESVAIDRKLIKTVWLELESKSYEESLKSLEKLVEAAGGYLESQSEQGISYYASGSYRSRYATLTARIPADRLEEVTEAAGELCNVVSRSSDVSDITDTYTDTEARLETLKLQEERLLAILAKATTLSDVIELEQSLSNVRYEIESITAQLKNMDGQVSYSTLNITLSEVVEYNLVTSPPETLGKRLADAWQNAWSIVKNGTSNFLVWLVTYLPSILIWVVLLGGLGWLGVRTYRRRGKGIGKRPQPPATKQEDKHEDA